MTITEFYDKIQKYAPIELSEKLCKKDGLYDNSGIIINAGEKEFTGAAFMLDLTLSGVEFADRNGCNLIVTHHPAIYSPIKSVDANSAIGKCIALGITVASMHLNLDCACRGTDYYFAKGLGGDNQLIAEDFGKKTGYGRLFAIKKSKLGELKERYKAEFNTERLEVYGNAERDINKIASFCGAGLDDGAIAAAEDFGADLIVSADVKHHDLLAATEKGFAVMNFTHYASENYGMKKICETFAKENKDEKIIFFGNAGLA